MLDLLDWLVKRQPRIEKSLARRHLEGGTLVLYDVTSSYVEGQCNALAAFGYNRDGKKGKKQIVFGLLCSAEGCPVAVEVFRGNTSDPMTVGPQITKLKQRFGITQIALVGDRGRLTAARIRDDLRPSGLDWVTILNSKQIRKLAAGSPREAELRPDELVARWRDGDQRCGFPRRTPDRVFQSSPGKGSSPKPRSTAQRHRVGTGIDRRLRGATGIQASRSGEYCQTR